MGMDDKIKAVFFKVLKKGEGYFTHQHSIENPMWFYWALMIGLPLLGFILGRWVL